MTTAPERITIRDEGAIWMLSLNRPEKRNALTRAMVRALADGLAALDAAPSACVGVLSGNGPSFCAGMDLAEFAGTDTGEGWESVLGPVTRRTRDKPLVAAVEGHAVAGGLEILMTADVIVASRTAVFALPEVRRGLVAAEGGLLGLTHRLPLNEVKRMALTGTPMSGERAHALGFVSELTEPGEALAAASEIAAAIATAAPLAVRASRRIVDGAPSWAATEMWEQQDRIAAAVILSADAREGALAFLERREPRWIGR